MLQRCPGCNPLHDRELSVPSSVGFGASSRKRWKSGEQLLRPAEVAARLAISVDNVRGMRKRGELVPHSIDGQRGFLFAAADVETIAAARGIAPAKAKSGECAMCRGTRQVSVEVAGKYLQALRG